jgi:dTDP-4-amino-4,6-dideoxygalactose transaminase
MPPSALEPPSTLNFSIGFDRRDLPRLHSMWDSIVASERWSEGPFTEQFEQLWSGWNGLPSVATSSWAGAALAALEFIGVKGETVLCPSNTFMATPLSVLKAGGRVEFVDCNRNDLCLSHEDFIRKAERFKPKACWLVHIGGHIAFEVEQIADYCRKNGIWLLEDCAHAHGAEWDGRKPGSWGDAGVYSFYATKTVSTGEGGMLVTRYKELEAFARKHRNYGKPSYEVEGFNFRISEFAAAIGCVQTQRLPEIVAWKNDYARRVLDPRFSRRLTLPEGMTSGYYKYILFEPAEPSTGKVYDQPCHRILGRSEELPNTDWVSRNHWCAPIYYRPDA